MKIYILFLLAALWSPTQAVNCWVCEDAESNADCQRTGDLITCSENQVCHNEVRKSGENMRVTKKCKQDQACENSEEQNFRGHSAQCNVSKPNYVCRCCCNFDECNRRLLPCVEDAAESQDENSLLTQPRIFTEFEITILRETWSILEGNDTMGLVIFQRLFNDAPQIRPLFYGLLLPNAEQLTLNQVKENGRARRHAARFIQAIANVVDLLETRSELATYLNWLGNRHAHHQIDPMYFDRMGPILLSIIQVNLHVNKKSHETRAWSKLYSQVRNTIQRGIRAAA